MVRVLYVVIDNAGDDPLSHFGMNSTTTVRPTKVVERFTGNNQVSGRESVELSSNLSAESSSVRVNDVSAAELDIPDSGWRAWLTVLGAFCANGITIGFVNSTGTIQDYLLTHQLADESSSSVGWIFSIFIFLMFFCGIQAGPLVDIYGATPLLVPGCLLWCLALMMMSFCTEYYQFILSLSILGGVSTSLIYNPGYTVIGQWFTSKKPLAMSIVAIGSVSISSFLPIVLSDLFSSLGFAWGIRIVGFIFMGLSIICCFTVKSRLRSTRKYNWREASIDFKSFKSANYTWCVAAALLSEWAVFLPALYIVSYCRSVLNYSDQESNLFLVYQNVSSIAGRILAGFAAKYYGSFNVMAVANLLCAISVLGIWIPGGMSHEGMVAFAVTFGMFSGASFCVAPPCIAHISTPTNFGKRYGTAFACVSVAVLTSLPIGGALTGNDYLGMKITTGLVYVAAAVCTMISRHYTPHVDYRV